VDPCIVYVHDIVDNPIHVLFRVFWKGDIYTCPYTTLEKNDRVVKEVGPVLVLRKYMCNRIIYIMHIARLVLVPLLPIGIVGVNNKAELETVTKDVVHFAFVFFATGSSKH
jgi:hypothetical protein